MSDLKNLPTFLTKEIQELGLVKQSLFLCRNDGVILYKKHLHQFDQETASALLSGIWQAASALTDLLPNNTTQKKNDFFRLSFDTSSKGIYLVPTTLNGKDCFWGMIFNEETNPAQIKVKLRELATKLENFLEKTENKKPITKGHPFSELTDEEIDLAFQKMRN